MRVRSCTATLASAVYFPAGDGGGKHAGVIDSCVGSPTLKSL